MDLLSRVERVSVGAMLNGVAGPIAPGTPGGVRVDEERYKEPIRRLFGVQADSPTKHPVFFQRFCRTGLYIAPLLDRCFGPETDGSQCESACGLAGKSVLEIGCGIGSRTAPLSMMAGRVLACDILPGDVEIARGHTSRLGLRNIEFRVCNATEIIKSSAIHECDLVMLYAVLEHTTIAERLEILSAIHENIRPDAVVYVGETPNRLAAFDSHSSQLPFYQSLPDELAMEYLKKSPRDEWRRGILNASDPGEMMYRRGRGLSFHEFDICFGGLDRLARGVVRSLSDPLLLNLYGYRPDEQLLRRRLSLQGIKPADTFSRSWIEFAYRPGEAESASGLHSPEVGVEVLDASQMQSPERGKDALGNVLTVATRGHEIVFSVDGPCDVSIGVVHGGSRGAFVVKMNGRAAGSFDIETVRQQRPEFLTYHGSSFIPLGRAGAGQSEIVLQPMSVGARLAVSVAVTRPSEPVAAEQGAGGVRVASRESGSAPASASLAGAGSEARAQ